LDLVNVSSATCLSFSECAETLSKGGALLLSGVALNPDELQLKSRYRSPLVLTGCEGALLGVLSYLVVLRCAHQHVFGENLPLQE